MWEKKQNTPQKRECHAKQNRKLSMPENTIFMELRLFSPGFELAGSLDEEGKSCIVEMLRAYGLAG